MAKSLNRLVKEKLIRFSLEDHRPVHPRALDLGVPLPPRTGNPVVSISGVRRCGKSHRLFQEMDRLLAQGVSPERIGYFDFDDDRLGQVTAATGAKVVETFLALHPLAQREGAYLFLDGIETMARWEPWVGEVARGDKMTVYVAGTTIAHPLDAPSVKGGGLVEFTLHPYSFAEHRQAIATRGIPETPIADRNRAALFEHRSPLSRYLTSGGFPDALGLPDDERMSLLQRLRGYIVLRDIVERLGLDEPHAANLFVQRLFAANSKLFSLRNTARALRGVGFDLDRESLRTLLDAAFAIGLAYRIPFCLLPDGGDAPEQCKVYAVDPGLAFACTGTRGNNVSFLLENAVYLELRRRVAGRSAHPVRCLKMRESGHEVDFVTGDPSSGEPTALYQVTWDIRPKAVKERETRALMEAFDVIERLSGGPEELPEATIIVGDSTPEALADARAYLDDLGPRGRRIALIPASEWLLGEAGPVDG